ncbi:MAG TPA: glycosyltransferase family 4 protein [Solirubrobacteraceae bacterium]|nr:glycosyltransferase family 4 protein [Solirubrobacteraceae bacterium]
MRVQIVDPSAYTPPYDHALCRALAAAGADVELYTSRFVYGPVAPEEGYVRRETFYRLATRLRRARLRRAVKLAEHVPDMLRYRHAARDADIVHLQWLTVQQLDRHLLPRGRRRPPLVLTAHDVLPREPRRGQLGAQRRLYDRVDAVVVHSEHGRRRLTVELGIEPSRVHVIPHGVFEHLAREPSEPQEPSRRPIVLCFGLMRPYKGIDLLLEAWRAIDDAELWIAGMPRMDIAPLRASAPPNVRFFPRFITDAEIPGFFRAADLVVLPYREIDQSGVLFTALAFGKPLLLSDVGGFPEVAAAGAARTFPAGDAAALRAALEELLADRAALSALADGARDAASGSYSWAAVAARTLELYESLLGGDRRR